MKKSIYLFMIVSLLGLIVSSCKNENENENEQVFIGVFINRVFYITYVNTDGTNILRNDSQLDVFYEQNGIAQKVERLNLDYPNGYTLTSLRNTAPNGSDELCVKVFPSDYYNEGNISTTFIKLGNNQMDTLRCQFQTTSNTFILTKIWLNGTLVWDKETAKASPLIQIIK